MSDTRAYQIFTSDKETPVKNRDIQLEGCSSPYLEANTHAHISDSLLE